MRQAADISEIVRTELDRITEERVRHAIAGLLVTPRCEDRPWNYGAADATFPCWIVLEHLESDTGIAFCEEGFGPRSPWGLLFLSGDHLSMGDDSGWFRTLEDAF